MKSIIKTLFCVCSGAAFVMATIAIVSIVGIARGVGAYYGKEKGYEMWCKFISDGFGSM